MDYFSIKSCSLRGGLIWIGMGNIEVFKGSKYFIDLENLFILPINIKKDTELFRKRNRPFRKSG